MKTIALIMMLVLAFLVALLAAEAQSPAKGPRIGRLSLGSPSSGLTDADSHALRALSEALCGSGCGLSGYFPNTVEFIPHQSQGGRLIVTKSDDDPGGRGHVCTGHTTLSDPLTENVVDATEMSRRGAAIMAWTPSNLQTALTALETCLSNATTAASGKRRPIATGNW